jgi:hypothetical protein
MNPSSSMNDVVIITNDNVETNSKIDETDNKTVEATDKTVIKITKKLSRKAETVLCDKCGFTYKRSNKTHHLRTKKHSDCISRDKLKNI